jgi:phosphatidate phosphatase APP1
MPVRVTADQRDDNTELVSALVLVHCVDLHVKLRASISKHVQIKGWESFADLHDLNSQRRALARNVKSHYTVQQQSCFHHRLFLPQNVANVSITG